MNFTHKSKSPHHGLQSPHDLAFDVFLICSFLPLSHGVLLHWLPCWCWNILACLHLSAFSSDVSLVPDIWMTNSLLQGLAQSSSQWRLPWSPYIKLQPTSYPHSRSALSCPILLSIVLNHLPTYYTTYNLQLILLITWFTNSKQNVTLIREEFICFFVCFCFFGFCF